MTGDRAERQTLNRRKVDQKCLSQTFELELDPSMQGKETTKRQFGEDG